MQIALIDSGIGGLTLLKRLIHTCPNNDYLYFADTYLHPYGKQSPVYLRTRLLKISEMLYEKGVKCLIFACNTASSIALEDCVKSLPIPVLGVKPTCKSPKDALILCTPLTALGSVVKGYERQGARVYSNLCLATLVERYCDDLSVLENYLTSELSVYKGVKEVALGCTHYVFLREIIERVLETRTIDGYEPIIGRVLDLGKEEKRGKLEFIFTGPKKQGKYQEILSKLP